MPTTQTRPEATAFQPPARFLARPLLFFELPDEGPLGELPCPAAPRDTPHDLSTNFVLHEGAGICECEHREGARKCGAIIWLLSGLRTPDNTRLIVLAQVRYSEMVEIERHHRWRAGQVLAHLTRTPLPQPTSPER